MRMHNIVGLNGDPARYVVTGAGSGLGRAMTAGLAQAGALVVAADIDAAAAEQTQRDAQGPSGRILPYRIDLSKPAECYSLIDQMSSQHGGIDVIVNCAGLNMVLFSRDFLTKPVRFWEVDPNRWQMLYDVNIRAPFLLSRRTAPLMMKQGWGRIVNVTTSFSTLMREGNTPFGQAKAAFEAASACWAEELRGSGVTCNVLLPGGAADTPMIPANSPFDRRKLVPPAAMVPPLLYLTSRDAETVKGIRILAARWSFEDDVPVNLARASAPIAWPALGAEAGPALQGSAPTR